MSIFTWEGSRSASPFFQIRLKTLKKNTHDPLRVKVLLTDGYFNF